MSWGSTRLSKPDTSPQNCGHGQPKGKSFISSNHAEESCRSSLFYIIFVYLKQKIFTQKTEYKHNNQKTPQPMISESPYPTLFKRHWPHSINLLFFIKRLTQPKPTAHKGPTKGSRIIKQWRTSSISMASNFLCNMQWRTKAKKKIKLKARPSQYLKKKKVKLFEVY